MTAFHQWWDEYKHKMGATMRFIYVVERNDRKPFPLTLHKTELQVIGVGFPDEETAKKFQLDLPNADEFHVDSLFEGPSVPMMGEGQAEA